MAVDPSVVDLLAKRRNRLLGVILGVKERDCDGYLPESVSTKFRKVILDQTNDFFTLVLDVLESTADGSVVNDLLLERLDSLSDGVERLVASLEG